MEIKFPLFKNDKKEGNQPDYKFFDKERGVEAAAWIRTSNKNGRKYLSVVYKDIRETAATPETGPRPVDDFLPDDDLDESSDIPF